MDLGFGKLKIVCKGVGIVFVYIYFIIKLFCLKKNKQKNPN